MSVGETYRLAWDLDLRTDFSGLSRNGPSFGIFLDNQTFVDALFVGEQLVDGYVSHFLHFVATATEHTLIFAGELDGRSNDAGRTDVSYNVDNICLDTVGGACGGVLEAVPEPASLSLLALGFLGLVLSRRRDGSQPNH